MISFVLLFFIQTLQAFPQYLATETTRCVRCHSEQTGLGLLTAEGKIFSTQSWAENTKPYFQIPLPDWLNLGIKSKQQQSFYQSDYIREATFKDVQTELRSEIRVDKTQLYVSFGRYIPTTSNVTFKDYAYVSTAYLQYQQNSYLSFKAGKYFLNYGYDLYQLNYDPMLYSLSSIKKGSEKNQIEVNYSQDQYDISIAQIFNQTQFNQVYSENAQLLKLNYIFDSHLSLGANIYQSYANDVIGTNQDKILTGIFGILNWDEKKSVLFQIDQVLYKDVNKKGASILIRPSYEWRKGHLVMTKVQYINQNIQLSDPKFLELSIGYNYIPYAQFNILAQYKKTTNSLGALFIEDTQSQLVTLDFNFLM